MGIGEVLPTVESTFKMFKKTHDNLHYFVGIFFALTPTYHAGDMIQSSMTRDDVRPDS